MPVIVYFCILWCFQFSTLSNCHEKSAAWHFFLSNNSYFAVSSAKKICSKSHGWISRLFSCVLPLSTTSRLFHTPISALVFSTFNFFCQLICFPPLFSFFSLLEKSLRNNGAWLYKAVNFLSFVLPFSWVGDNFSANVFITPSIHLAGNIWLGLEFMKLRKTVNTYTKSTVTTWWGS